MANVNEQAGIPDDGGRTERIAKESPAEKGARIRREQLLSAQPSQQYTDEKLKQKEMVEADKNRDVRGPAPESTP